MNDVVSFHQIRYCSWNKIPSDNVIYKVKNLGGSKDNLSWETVSETQNVTLVLIKTP